MSEGMEHYPVAVQRLLMLSGRYLLGTSSSSSFSVRAAASRDLGSLVKCDQLTTFIALENLRRLFWGLFKAKIPRTENENVEHLKSTSYLGVFLSLKYPSIEVGIQSSAGNC